MAVKKTQESHFEDSDMGTQSIVYLWCLRMLMICGGHRKFIEKSGFSSDEILSELGLEEYAEKELKRPVVLKKLKRMHADAEKKEYSYPAALTNNLPYILDRISLDEIETDILLFFIMLNSHENLEECSDTLGKLDKSKLIRHLSNILQRPQPTISKALAMNGQLALSGLIKIDTSWARGMQQKVDLMDGLADNLLVPELDTLKLFESSFINGATPKLDKDSFAHVRKEYDLMKSYLAHSFQKTGGINILIHGKPGTGKTEMVRTLAKDVEASLYEVSMEDADGDPLSSSNRFSAYQLSQQLLSHTPNAVVMFDEIEDVFPENSFFGKPDPRSTEKKAWINRLLESNKVPAFWLSNKVYHIDQAFLRRFDYVLEMPAPTRSMRQKIFADYLDGVSVSAKWMQKMSNNKNLLPAHIEKAAKVVRHIASEDVVKNESTLESVLEGTQEVLGLHGDHSLSDINTSYSLDYLSTSADIPNMVKGLKRNGRGNICFYGPPGTGKTALGQYIAEHLDKPLIIKRASDILNMYVGGTEKNIAAMFREAKREDGVLLLDEADSFLRDRRGASRSWEVTQVNELLVQMENFEGLFICSTNLMDNFDQASLRRFAIKVEFDYLKPDQAWKMLQKECVGKATTKDRRGILNIRNLTPGDFAAVKKRLDILDMKATANTLIKELGEEVNAKSDMPTTPIGFVA